MILVRRTAPRLDGEGREHFVRVPLDLDLRNTFSTFPSRSITNVVRSMPQNDRPYMFFSL